MREFSGAAPVYAVVVPPGFTIENPAPEMAPALEAAATVPPAWKFRLYQGRVARRGDDITFHESE